MKYILLKDIPLNRIIENSYFSFEYSPQNDGENNQHEKKYGEYGIFYPPLLVQNCKSYHIVMGKKFIDYYKTHRNVLPWALVVSDLEDNYEMLKFSIFLKNELGSFNVIEKAIALRRAKELKGYIEREILMLFGIPFNQRIIENYLLLSDAPEMIKLSIIKGELNELTAFEIFRFLPEEREMLTDFIKKLAIGTKKRNKILQMIYEIRLRDGINPVELVSCSEVEKILNLSMDQVHIAQKVFEYFEQLRYPSIYEYRKRFKMKLKETGITKYFHFIAPSNFETRDFKIVLTFSSKKEFKEKIKSLEEIGEKKAFSELMEMKY